MKNFDKIWVLEVEKVKMQTIYHNKFDNDGKSAGNVVLIATVFATGRAKTEKV
jgi:hypothetical protein